MGFANYDDTLNDTTCHAHVLAARNAGRAWAEREADTALDDAAIVGAGGWLSSESDARPLVAFGPASLPLRTQ